MTSGLYYHMHHESLMEWTSNLEERIAYIKAEKPEDEIETRLRWMTPVSWMPAYLKEADRKWEEADREKQHKKDHPGCPWNGKTIFPVVRGA